MKSLNDIEMEIKELVTLSDQERIERIEVKKSELSRRKKRVAFLRLCKKYLESDPTKEFMTKEKSRLQNRLDKITEGFDTWKQSSTHKTPYKEYNKMMGVLLVKEQLKTIKFLLN